MGRYDLVFDRAPRTDYDIIFGLSATNTPIAGVFVLDGLFAPKAKGILTDHVYIAEAALSYKFTAPFIDAYYNIDTFKGFTARIPNSWQAAQNITVCRNKQTQEARIILGKSSFRFSQAEPVASNYAAVFEQAHTLNTIAYTVFENSAELGVNVSLSQQIAVMMHHGRASGWQNAMTLHMHSADAMQNGVWLSQYIAQNCQDGVPVGLSFNTNASYAEGIYCGFEAFYQNAEAPINQYTAIPPPPIDNGGQLHNFDLVFRCKRTDFQKNPQDYSVVFNHPCQMPSAPSVDFTEVLYMINAVTVTNLETGQILHPVSVDFATDTSSFAWSGSLRLYASDQTYLTSPTGKAVKVQIDFNGKKAVFMLGKGTRQVSFNKDTYSYRIISPTVVLDSPYSEPASYNLDNALAAQTLAEGFVDASTSGITLNWQYLDALTWVVRANCFRTQNITPKAAIAQLLENSGAFMYSELDGQTLTIKPKRPYAFWEIFTEFKTLPSDTATRMGTSEEFNRNHDGVYVISGNETAQGITAFVKRDGTAGASLHPQLINPALTSNEASRLAGKYALGASGKVETETIALPITETGELYQVGDAVSHTKDGVELRGTVVSTAISVGFNKQVQMLGVEFCKGFV